MWEVRCNKKRIQGIVKRQASTIGCVQQTEWRDVLVNWPCSNVCRYVIVSEMFKNINEWLSTLKENSQKHQLFLYKFDPISTCSGVKRSIYNVDTGKSNSARCPNPRTSLRILFLFFSLWFVFWLFFGFHAEPGIVCQISPPATTHWWPSWSICIIHADIFFSKSLFLWCR